MKIKSIIYLSLVLGLFLLLSFLKSKQEENRKLDTSKNLIERLKIIDPDHNFTIYFMISDGTRDQNKGTLYKIFDKTEENTFKLKSKPDYIPPSISKGSLMRSPMVYGQEIFDDINIVSIEVLENLLRSFDDFSWEMTVYNEATKYPNLFTDEARSKFSRYSLGLKIGMDFLLRSILVLFFLMIVGEYLMKKYPKGYFALTWFSPIGIIMGYRLLAFLEYGIASYNTFFVDFLIAIVELLLITVPILIFKLLSKRMSSNLDFLDKELMKAVLMFMIGITFLFIMHFFLVNFITRELVGDKIFEHDYRYNSISIISFGIMPLVSLVIANTFHNTLKHLLALWRENKSRKKDVIKAEAALSSIQSSINPHFLYNALNSIATLTKSDPVKTEKMTLALSSFYKYVTNREGNTFSTIEKEIEMIKTYLEIEKVRFEDRLKFDIEINKELEAIEIPNFLLQPMVENAIKYGYDKSTDTINIKIKIAKTDNELTINIFDQGRPFDDNLSKGYGLRSVTKKLQHLYPNRHEISFNNNPKHVLITLNLESND